LFDGTSVCAFNVDSPFHSSFYTFHRLCISLFLFFLRHVLYEIMMSLSILLLGHSAFIRVLSVILKNYDKIHL